MSGIPNPEPHSDGWSGQGLVEFALVLPVFLLLLFGLLDVGRLVYTNSVLSQAAREGARLGATEAARIGADTPACVDNASDIGTTNPGAQVCPVNVAAFKSHVVDAVKRMAVGLEPITAIHISCNDSSLSPSGAWTETSGGNGCQDGAGNSISGSGDEVSVRIEYTYRPMTPIISTLFDAVSLSGSATMETT